MWYKYLCDTSIYVISSTAGLSLMSHVGEETIGELLNVKPLSIMPWKQYYDYSMYSMLSLSCELNADCYYVLAMWWVITCSPLMLHSCLCFVVRGSCSGFLATQILTVTDTLRVSTDTDNICGIEIDIIKNLTKIC